jgi:dTDP-4-amino-4,6-dideoxygalactose transaminase
MNGSMIPHFGLRRQYLKLREELLDATDRVLSTGNLMSGQYTTEFEDWLANRTGAKYAVTVHSGTQALEIIARYRYHTFNDLFQQGAFKGRQPIVRIPNLTYPATLNAFITAGWNIELVDTDKNGMVPSLLNDERQIGIFECIIGLYGAKPKQNFKWQVDNIVDGAQHWLVADGNIGSGMAISFDPTKNLPASGNGGAIVTQNPELYEYAFTYKNNSMREHRRAGTNSKMSEQECAQIMVRTQYIDEWQARREKIKQYWCNAFENIPIRCLSAGIDRHANQKFVIYTDDRLALNQYLTVNGIETKINYPYALSELPVAAPYARPDMLSTSVMLSRGVLSLPIYPELTDAEVEFIAEKVITFYKR